MTEPRWNPDHIPDLTRRFPLSKEHSRTTLRRAGVEPGTKRAADFTKAVERILGVHFEMEKVFEKGPSRSQARRELEGLATYAGKLQEQVLRLSRLSREMLLRDAALDLDLPLLLHQLRTIQVEVEQLHRHKAFKKGHPVHTTIRATVRELAALFDAEVEKDRTRKRSSGLKSKQVQEWLQERRKGREEFVACAVVFAGIKIAGLEPSRATIAKWLSHLPPGEDWPLDPEPPRTGTGNS